MNSNFLSVQQAHSDVSQEQGRMQLYAVPPPSILPPPQSAQRYSYSSMNQGPSAPVMMVVPVPTMTPIPPIHRLYGYSMAFEQMHARNQATGGGQTSLSSSSSTSSTVTSTFEFKVTSVMENHSSNTSSSNPERKTAITNEPTAVPSCNLSKTISPDQLMEQFHELIKTALDGCKKAEALATCHQKRPCFKKIDSLCARLKQDLVKTDNVMSNINSQGLAWAVKDFIFVFTRIMNAWIIIKGYVHNKPEGLTSIQRELCPNFLDAFGRWHDTTHELVQSIIKSFINLNKLAKQQRGGCNIFTKVEETISPGKGNPNINQTLHDSLDDIEEAESSLKLSDGAYIRAGIYPNVIGPPPGLPEKPQFTPCNKQQDHDQMPKTTFDTSPVSSNRPEMHDHAAAPNNPKSKASGNESDTDRLIRKTSLACINWVLEEVRVIEEGQYFYCINFTKNYFPDFHLIGSTMMDLRTVYKKHESGLYLMMADLLDDLQQILDTCKRYVEVSLAFELWNPKNPIPDPCTESQRQEMENFPKIQTFIAKMELLLSNIRKESPMEDRKKMESTMPPKGDTS